MSGFLDIGLSDILSAYLEVESESYGRSMDAKKQGTAQAAAVLDAEKVSQTAEINDALDEMRMPSVFNDKTMLYVGGGVLLLLLGYAVLKK